MAWLQDSLALHQGPSTRNLCLHTPKHTHTHTETQTHTHSHTISTNRNLIRAGFLCSRANSESPEYVSASPNDASTRRDTKEEQTGKRDGCEKPSLAVTLTSLSLTHTAVHTRQAALTSAHKSSLREHKWKTCL